MSEVAHLSLARWHQAARRYTHVVTFSWHELNIFDFDYFITFDCPSFGPSSVIQRTLTYSITFL